MPKLTQNEFIEKAKQIHEDYYNYSLTEYTKSREKIVIICPKHGIFKQRASHHLAKIGCQKCGLDKLSNHFRMSQEQFLEKSKKIHNNKYDYSKSIYGKNQDEKIIITCPFHGDFLQTPGGHVLGRGCIQCGINKNKGKKHYYYNPDREYIKLRKKISLKCLFALKRCLRLQDKEKLFKTEELLGYSREEFYNHIISHQNWEKVKDNKWHLDHILPVSAFVEYGITDLKIINALDNLQPLLGNENLSKADKYSKEDFYNYLTRKNVILYSHPCG